MCDTKNQKELDDRSKAKGASRVKKSDNPGVNTLENPMCPRNNPEIPQIIEFSQKRIRARYSKWASNFT